MMMNQIGEGVSLYFSLVDVLCNVVLSIFVIPFIALSFLKNIAIDNEYALATRVRGTILFLLSCTIIPNFSTICVKVFYGTFRSMHGERFV